MIVQSFFRAGAISILETPARQHDPRSQARHAQTETSSEDSSPRSGSIAPSAASQPGISAGSPRAAVRHFGKFTEAMYTPTTKGASSRPPRTPLSRPTPAIPASSHPSTPLSASADRLKGQPRPVSSEPTPQHGHQRKLNFDDDAGSEDSWAHFDANHDSSPAALNPMWSVGESPIAPHRGRAARLRSQPHHGGGHYRRDSIGSMHSIELIDGDFDGFAETPERATQPSSRQHNISQFSGISFIDGEASAVHSPGLSSPWAGGGAELSPGTGSHLQAGVVPTGHLSPVQEALQASASVNGSSPLAQEPSAAESPGPMDQSSAIMGIPIERVPHPPAELQSSGGRQIQGMRSRQLVVPPGHTATSPLTAAEEGAASLPAESPQHRTADDEPELYPSRHSSSQAHELTVSMTTPDRETDASDTADLSGIQSPPRRLSYRSRLDESRTAMGELQPAVDSVSDPPIERATPPIPPAAAVEPTPAPDAPPTAGSKTTVVRAPSVAMRKLSH